MDATSISFVVTDADHVGVTVAALVEVAAPSHNWRVWVPSAVYVNSDDEFHLTFVELSAVVEIEIELIDVRKTTQSPTFEGVILNVCAPTPEAVPIADPSERVMG
jgi:hypothetical protein